MSPVHLNHQTLQAATASILEAVGAQCSDDAALDRFAELVAEKLFQKQQGQNLKPTPIKKMTVIEFAVAIQRCPEYVRRHIRLQKIPRAEINGPPYLLSPRALLRYDVTPEEAQSRIAIWKQAQIPLPEQQRPAA